MKQEWERLRSTAESAEIDGELSRDVYEIVPRKDTADLHKRIYESCTEELHRCLLQTSSWIQGAKRLYQS